MLQKIKFMLFSNWKKLIKIRVEFRLITKSGDKICSEHHEVKKLNLMIINYCELDYFKYIKQMNQEYKTNLNKLANVILDKFQKKKRHEFNKGVLNSGDYIVKCVWIISPEFKRISYKEYKKWKIKCLNQC